MHEIRQQTKVIAIGHLNDSDNLKILLTFYNKCVKILLSTLWIKQRENQRNIKTKKKKMLTPEKPPRKSHCIVKKQQQPTDYITDFQNSCFTYDSRSSVAIIQTIYL